MGELLRPQFRRRRIPAVPRPELPRLTRAHRVAILAICVALFLFARGPIWLHPFSPDASILWSYAPIPFLVVAALLVEKKLRFASVLVETILLVILKFGITAAVLVSLWMWLPQPPP